MLRSMFSGLAGLSVHQTALDVVGDNLANINTIGNKASRIQFTSLLSQTVTGASSPMPGGRGGTNPIQIGLGVGAASINVNHDQGNLQSTDKMSDLAIQGTGFFILSDGSSQKYTRAGAFAFDALGTLVYSNGMKVQGWKADTSGNIDTQGSLASISIPVGETIKANETKKIEYANNLDSRANLLGSATLDAGNTAGIDRVSGKYNGDTMAVDKSEKLSPIIDTVGSHVVSVYAETHTGARNDLNATATLTSLGITDLDSFRVVVNNDKKYSISLSNGLSSTLSELISAINSQVPAVIAEIDHGAIKLTQKTAGLDSTVYVEDIDFDFNGIAANLFFGQKTNEAQGKWAAHAQTVGTKKEIKLDEKLTAIGIDRSNIFQIAVKDKTYDFDLSDAAHDLNNSDRTVGDLITKFNEWEISKNFPAAERFFMGLNSEGSLYVAHNYEDDDGSISVYDKTSGDKDGVAEKLFAATPGEWGRNGLDVSEGTAYTVARKVLSGASVVEVLDSELATQAGSTPNLNLENSLIVIANGQDYTFNLNSNDLTTDSTVGDLITKFNEWKDSLKLDPTDDFSMGLDVNQRLYLKHSTDDTAGAVKVKDASSQIRDGVVNLLFNNDVDNTNWDPDANVYVNQKTQGKISKKAYIKHAFTEKDGGGTHISRLTFANRDSTIEGIDGVSIMVRKEGLKQGSFMINTAAATTHKISTAVYDSLGNPRSVSLTFTRISDNTWNWSASGIDITGSGTLTFDESGYIRSGSNSGLISVGAQGGGSSLAITPDFSKVVQFADNSTIVHTSQDGYANGALSNYNINSSGEILGIYTNGLNQKIGQLAIAAFNNPEGLIKEADSMFGASNNSGEVQIGTASTGGRGSLSAGTLEMSNVDVAQEFANIIIYQRGFQANAKIISTGDEILQTVVNMKR